MYVTESMIREMEHRYGVPSRVEFVIPVTPAEVARIRSTQRDGRNHDVTLYVHKEGQWIVIAKPVYPKGLFRAPSGGIHKGEDFETGMHREMTEEIGCEIRIERFLLRTSVEFTSNPDAKFRVSKLTPDRDGFSSNAVNPHSDLDSPLAVDVGSSPDIVWWRSFVFVAEYISGDFNYTDRHEIREVRLVDWPDFDRFGSIMRQSPMGGLHYRAALHEAVKAEMGATGSE